MKKKSRRIKFALYKALIKIRTIIYHFIQLDLKIEVEDFEKIHAEIESNSIFKGTNLWILVFAVVIASVGLNINSTAVIIGAMLISPLMGPINGIGYSLAVYDMQLFKRAIKNFSFAVLTSLIASTVYFIISPVSTAHSEILARTSPTIYDVLIAFFGGLAGIVAISSKSKGNVIPGVAIATALMPPLCTAGYGLASGQLIYFFGSFYLFTINTVFIALSSVIISKALKFPIRDLIDPIRKKRVNHYIYSIIIITLLPSIYFGYVLVLKERFSENATKYIKNISLLEGGYLLRNEIEPGKKIIRLIYGGNSLTNKNKAEILQKTKEFKLEHAHIIIKQGFSTNESSNNEIGILKTKFNDLLISLNKSEQKKDSILNRSRIGLQILTEIKPFYPQIKSCSYSETVKFTDDKTKTEKVALIIFTIPKNSLGSNEKTNITRWTKKRLKNPDVKILFEVATKKKRS